jgi:hypothetical protein
LGLLDLPATKNTNQGICTNLGGGKNTTVTQYDVLKHCTVTDFCLMKHCKFACEICKVTCYKQTYYSPDGIKLENLFKTQKITSKIINDI